MGEGTLMEAGDIVEKVVRNIEFYADGGITATGGEPLMQMDFLIELFYLAKQRSIPLELRLPMN